MVDTKSDIYKIAYFELYEIIRNLSANEIKKIPKSFIQNLKIQMKKNNFVYDKEKNISDQNMLPQTKALVIEMYCNYLATEEEKDKIKKYKQICFNSVEEKKKYLYDSKVKEDIFEKDNEPKFEFQPKQEVALIKKEEISIFNKIIQKIFRFFKNVLGKNRK